MEVQPTFSISALLQASTALRTMGQGRANMEDTATAIVGYLRGHLVDKETGESALALARFFLTRRFDELSPDLQDYARAAGTDAGGRREVQCLTLLATAGEEPAWNDRRASASHQAIPLPSVEAVRRSPMIARLVEQLGLDPRQIVDPNPASIRESEERTYDVFYVPDARTSLSLPAQDNFVIPYGIRSAIGLGGLLPDGALFAVVLFSTVPIPPTTLDAFAAIALSVKIAVLPYLGAKVFAGEPARRPGAGAPARSELLLLRSENTALSQLLDVRAAVVEREAQRLERLAGDAVEGAEELARSRAALMLSEARKTSLIEEAPDCVIGMDCHGRITDFNHAAEATLGYSRRDVVGEMMADTLIPYPMRQRHRLGLARMLETGAGPIIGRRIEVNALRSDGTEVPVELTVKQVAGVDPPMFNGYLRDITSARRAADELAASHRRLAHIARTLQTSLLPPTLPDIDGIELGAAFDALGDGYEVGGDFYDVFQLADGRWALTLGDVCGKGSQAAVVTALARYTLRAAAMRRSNPAAVLKMLNEAVHRQQPDQFCTVVYATIDPATGAVDLALGGHPHPLVLRTTGQVTAVGTTSPLLGPYEAWSGSTDSFTLDPGDLLVLYTDGVTDARSGTELFGDERLAATVASAKGHGAPAAAQLIEQAVLNFGGELNDDLAILAIRRV